MKSTSLIMGILMISFLGCKSQQYSVDELPEKRLVFGNGGGITGASDSYILLENGQLFHENSLTKQSLELKSISKNEAKECFMKLEELSLSEMDFDYPGNRYYFLEEIDGDSHHRIVWGSNDKEVSSDCQNFYDDLKRHVNNRP